MCPFYLSLVVRKINTLKKGPQFLHDSIMFSANLKSPILFKVPLIIEPIWEIFPTVPSHSGLKVDECFKPKYGKKKWLILRQCHKKMLNRFAKFLEYEIRTNTF